MKSKSRKKYHQYLYGEKVSVGDRSQTPSDYLGPKKQLPTLATLIRATRDDRLLSRVLTYVQRGWPVKVDSELKTFASKKTELSVEAGCLLWGMRVVVPHACQEAVLRELHASHPGIVKMKSLARIHVWWCGIDKDIENLVRECSDCQSVRNAPSTTYLHPWAWPDGPWKRVHVDFAGPFQGSMFMVLVDAYSKWLEVVPMASTTTEKTLEVLRGMFARYGLPDQIVSDNGPQFTSTEFDVFMKRNQPAWFTCISKIDSFRSPYNIRIQSLYARYYACLQN